MTKMTDVLRRADCASAMVTALVLAILTAAATTENNPSTDHQAIVVGNIAPAGKSVVTAQLRGPVTNADWIVRLPQPRPRADAIMATPSAAELEIARVSAEERCLTEALYYEARGEGREGQMAIAEVVFNRMHGPGYPGSICGVVYQGVGVGTSCQFSFACNGEMLRRKSAADWARARALAARILRGVTHLGNSTDGATYFHASDVEPDWSSDLERTVQIGNHIFYKRPPKTQAS